MTATTATDPTTNPVRTLLLSLRPQFADAILSGAKTVELRRRPINAQPGTPILLYASRPTMAIVGTARLQQTHVLAPPAAWRTYHTRLSLTRAEFDAYLDGSPNAHLLLLHHVCHLDQPLHLHQLRQDGQFQPPQSFRYITAADPVPLRDLIPRHDRGDRGETERPNTVPNPAVRRSTAPGSSAATTTRGPISHHRQTSKIADS